MSEAILGEQWFNLLKDEIQQPYFQELTQKLKEEFKLYKIYPAPKDIFKAYKITPPESVRILLLGQDSYCFTNDADGLAFSSQQSETPFSLRMIFRELDRDLFHTKNKEEFKQKFPTNNLENWSKKGVFLLNSCLTVRAGLPGSHANMGWEQFIYKTVDLLYKSGRPVLFVCFGNEAKKIVEQCRVNNTNTQPVFYFGHPATASKGKGKDLFSGCNFGSKVNHWLWKNGLEEINWKLDENV